MPNPANPLVPKARHLLTNESIVSLAKAGFDEQFIVELMQSSRTRLDASTAALIELKKQGLSEELIRFIALRERQADQPALNPAKPQAASGPAATTHIEKHWWGYRWVTLARRVEASRAVANRTFHTTGASTPQSESTGSPN